MKDSLFCCEVVFIIVTDRGSDGLWEGCRAPDSPGPFQRRGLQAVYSPFTVVYPGPWWGRKKGLPALEGITPAPGREETSLRFLSPTPNLALSQAARLAPPSSSLISPPPIHPNSWGPLHLLLLGSPLSPFRALISHPPSRPMPNTPPPRSLSAAATPPPTSQSYHCL